jgi:hypothetical protein
MNHSEILWESHRRLSQDRSLEKDQDRWTTIRVAMDRLGKALGSRTKLCSLRKAEKVRYRTANE